MLSKGRYCYANVARWTKDFNVLDYDKLFFPIFIGRCHWTLVVMNLVKKTSEYYDSINGAGATNLMEHLVHWLSDEIKDKYRGGTSYSTDGWKCTNKCSKRIPQQKNGIDCGIFLIMNADFLSDGVPIINNTYSQENVPYFRKKIAIDILKRRLSYRKVCVSSASAEEEDDTDA